MEVEDPDADFIDPSDLFRMHYIQLLGPQHLGVTSLVSSPTFEQALMTTAEGNLFRWSLPTAQDIEDVIRKLDEDALEAEPEDMEQKLVPLAKSHVNFITSVCFASVSLKNTSFNHFSIEMIQY